MHRTEDDVVWGDPRDGLRLGVGAVAGGVRLALENVGRTPVEVVSHVQAGGEIHLDWFTVVLDGPTGRRELTFADARNRSAPVRVRLAPSERLDHDVDLAAWALRACNGGARLAPGTCTAHARYEVAPGTGVWHGRLDAGPVGVVVTPAPPA